MRIELGEHVYSQDGHDIGTIKHLIVDPASNHVKTVVVEKGVFLHDDTEIALNALQSADSQNADGQIYVSYTAAQVKALPRFDITQYTPAPPHTMGVAAYPPGGLLWAGGYVAQPFAGSTSAMGAGVLPLTAPFLNNERLPETGDEQPEDVQAYRRHEDETNAVVSEGDQVLSKDGETVGEVHSVVIDSATGAMTALVVRKGFLFTHDTTLMADSIASVDDGVIMLTLNKDQLAI